MSVMEFIQVFCWVPKAVVEGLIPAAIYLVAVQCVMAPATIGRHDQLTKRDVQYAHCSPTGELDPIQQHDRPQHGFASFFPSAYCINHLRAATKTAAHKRRLLGIHLAILLGLLCIDGYLIYQMGHTPDHDLWEKLCNLFGFEAGPGTVLYVVGWIGHVIFAISVMSLVGFCFWSTALQTFWVYHIWKYEPGTVVVVPKSDKSKEEIGLTNPEKS